MATTETRSARFSGKTSSGSALTKTIANVGSTLVPSATEAQSLASKIVKLYDTGTSITSVHEVLDKKMDTEAIAS